MALAMGLAICQAVKLKNQRKTRKKRMDYFCYVKCLEETHSFDGMNSPCSAHL